MRDVWVGKITATTTPVANTNTATPFAVEVDKDYAVQPDVECRVATGASQAAVIADLTAGKGVKVEAGALYDRGMPPGHTHLGVVAIAGTVNADVFRNYSR